MLPSSMLQNITCNTACILKGADDLQRVREFAERAAIYTRVSLILIAGKTEADESDAIHRLKPLLSAKAQQLTKVRKCSRYPFHGSRTTSTAVKRYKSLDSTALMHLRLTFGNRD